MLLMKLKVSADRVLYSVVFRIPVLQAGDLYRAVRKDKEGALLWNKRCAS